MKATFRTKLVLLVSAAGLSLFVLIVIDALTARSEASQLERIEAEYLPILELGPKLSSRWEKLQRTFQDAAAAADDSQLADAARAREDLVSRLEEARSVLVSGEISALQIRLDRYYDMAFSVTTRMIHGETGEPLLASIADMQSRQKQVNDTLAKLTQFDRSRLASAFASLREARARAASLRIAIAVLCLLAVLSLSVWISRRMLLSLESLTVGFARFGRNELTEPIQVHTEDEVGEVARSANRMAHSLYELSQLRDRAEFRTTGQAKLAQLLQGELEPGEVCKRATHFLADYVAAPVAAFYAVLDDGKLSLQGTHGLRGDGSEELDRGPQGGLLGLVTETEHTVVLEDLPATYFSIRSGLGQTPPSAVWILPIVHLGRVIAILELGMLKTPHPEARGLLDAVSPSIAVVLHAALTRAAKNELLRETQAQAELLKKQEQELLTINEELTQQQEELRAANEELTQQTEELEAQQRTLAAHNTELEAARRELTQQAERLESVSRYKSQFLANMSHELRTPLNSMLILSEILSRNEGGRLDKKQVEYAASIHAAGTDLLKLINRVLDLAKIESGKLEIELGTVTVRETLAHLGRMYMPLAENRKLGFEMVVDKDIPETIFSDRSRIEQILTNLVGNAIKFTDHGKVTLEAQRQSREPLRLGEPLRDGIAFRVIDSGIGVAPEDQERIFEAFEQVEGGSQRRHGGTGLGLAISRELAQLLGGELTMSASPGGGAAFEVWLPLEAPHDTDGEHPKQPALPAEPAAARALAPVAKPDVLESGVRARSAEPGPLLIIEDDLNFAEQVSDIAAERGLHTVLAKDGTTGLHLARVHTPCAIVLDLRLPDIDGHTVIERLRANPATASIPIHVVSGMDDGGRAIALGAVGYLRKPTSRSDLLSVLRSLAPAEGSTPRILVVEDDRALGGSVVDMLKNQQLQAVCVGSGEAALDAMRKEEFSCVVLDLGLPDISGLEVLEHMERDAGLPKLPVVIHTGRALSRAETHRLQRYTDSIVLKGTGSNERVLEELRLFLGNVNRPNELGKLRSPMPPHPGLYDRKVLVADDDMRTVYALSALLRIEGIEVFVADTGRAAVDLLHEHPEIEAVIIDIMMPEMDGYEAMRLIRSEARFATLPIIALTAKAMKDDRVRCIEAGASDYMPKPVDGGKLVSLLNAWLTAAE